MPLARWSVVSKCHPRQTAVYRIRGTRSHFTLRKQAFSRAKGRAAMKSVSLSSSPPHAADFVDLSATRSLNLNGGTLGLTDQRARDR
jgi:hypothetical protein